MRVANKKFSINAFCAVLSRNNAAGMVRGSALILTVVLTSLLAIVGVLFLMAARMDRMATSAVSQSLELDLAVDTVVAKISGQLIWDVPGTNVPGWGLPEYHDYPGPEDEWLAVTEPYEAAPGNYFWRQISDVTGYLRFVGWTTRGVPIVKVLDDSPIDLAASPDGQIADADGDGVADSKWIVIDGITSSKGEPVYAAIRVVDNCGKININTAFKFDPCDPDIARIDGTSLLQINLMALANRPGILPSPADVNALLLTRANYSVGVDPYNLYENAVIWQYGELPAPYTPFDISDELELRNRFLLNQRDIFVRIEELGWTGSFTNRWTLKVPIGLGGSSSNVNDWFARANISIDPDIYDYRHIATAHSMDRIINPLGAQLNNRKMVNVNTVTDKYVLHRAIEAGLLDAEPALAGADGLAAQIAVNLVDFRDKDPNITTFALPPPVDKIFYGFEGPSIYISEIAHCLEWHDKSDPSTLHRSYAIELYKPYFEDNDPDPNLWELVIDGRRISITWSGTRRFHVIIYEDPDLVVTLGSLVDFNDPYQPSNPHDFGYDPADYSSKSQVYDNSGAAVVFQGGSLIELQRHVAETGEHIIVDSITVPAVCPPSGWFVIATAGAIGNRGFRSIERDITPHKCIRALWADRRQASSPTLGWRNAFVHPDPSQETVQAHPANRPFTSIGEIGMVFAQSGYNVPAGSTEADLRLDFRDPLYANILNYLTVIDPTAHGRSPGEARIKGRININTAPPFVIAQLPWMVPGAVGPAIVEAVVAYRDKTALPGGPDYRGRPGPAGFRSVGELAQVWAPGFPGMDFYACDGVDQTGFPDLTPSDGAVDDFEERDLIFSRVSDLATVRSDVFTAYILVRIGADGPQKRVIAILDRSGVSPLSTSPYTTGKVKVRALHPVPDPW